MGRICLEGTADTPLQAVAGMEREWIAYEREGNTVEPTIYGIWNTFIGDVNAHKTFFNTSELLASKLLESIATMDDADFTPLPERNFSYTLKGNPDKEGQGHDIGSASLTKQYAFTIEETPMTLEAQVGINNSCISEAAQKWYAWELKKPSEARIFYARYDFHRDRWDFGAHERNVKSKFTPGNLPERYRREIADALQNAYRTASVKQAA